MFQTLCGIKILHEFSLASSVPIRLKLGQIVMSVQIDFDLS